MRVGIASALAGAGLLGIAVLVAYALTPDSAGQRAADFVRTVCIAAINDPAAVERMAKDQNWTVLTDRSSQDVPWATMIGTWRVARDDQAYLVSVATSHVRHGPQNICSVVFPESKLARAGFFSAISAAWDLEVRIDSTSAFRNEMYTINKVWPKDLVLQMTSSSDGILMSMTLLASL